MKCNHLILLSGLIGLLINPMCTFASTSLKNSCITTVRQNPINIPISFEFMGGTIENFAANNPLYIFFKVPSDAMSTINSLSYEHAAELLLQTGDATQIQLNNATAGVQLGNTNYIVLDMSAIPSLVSGGYIIGAAAMPQVTEWGKALTVAQASVLDNEFVVIAFNNAGQGTPSSFANAVKWKGAHGLKVMFLSQIYPE